jgi:predicted ATP-grasp superfamily ATP-dependent carboligase
VKLLEINPRFWGSLPLAIAAGVDFPVLLYRLATEGDVEPVRSYEVGITGISEYGDILHFVRTHERGKMLRSVLQLEWRRLHFDTLAWDDPLPFFAYPFVHLARRVVGG